MANEKMPVNKVHSKAFLQEGKNKESFDIIHLPIENYRDWYNAIISDDVEACDKILSSHPNKFLLLNGKFRYESLNTFKFKHPAKMKPFQPRYPLTIAACYKSSRVLKRMLEENIDLHVKDENSMNVIHCLLRAAYEDIEEEEKLADQYNILAKNEKISELLYEEDQDGLRPLEMAACLGLMNLFKLIFNTPGIYMAREVHQGHITYKWYDVTDYESTDKDNRKDRSPVVFFRHLEVNDLEKLEKEANSSWTAIHQWIDHKVYTNLPLVIIWFLMRFSFIVVCFILDVVEPTHTNSTTNTMQLTVPCQSFYELHATRRTHSALQTVIATIALVSVIFDIIEFLITRFSSKIDKIILKSRRKSGIHNPVVHTTYFRVFHSLFCTGVALCTFLQLYYKLYNINVSWSIFFLFASWSLLYFVQLLPQIGYLVVILERLVADTLQVMLVFFIFFMPFVHVFLKLLMRNNLCEIIRMDNIGYAMYDVFIVMVNMIAFKEGKSVTINSEIYGSHVMYVIIISTILLNLIIALYSDTVAQLAPHRSVIMQLQKLSVMLIIEKRLSWMLSLYYSRIQKHCFFIENGRVYLLDVQHSKKHVTDSTPSMKDE